MDLNEINSSEIKNLLGEDISSIINKLTDTRKVQEFKFKYSGKVEDNNDPEQLGRCKIRVYGIHSNDIPVSDLPWSLPDFDFIGSNLSSFIVPPNNVLVNVYFDKGDIYCPKYTTKVPDGNLPRGIEEDYPDTMVFFETEAGEYFKINRKTGKTTYRHSSGSIIILDTDGSIELTSDPAKVGNLNITIKGDAKFVSNQLTVGEPGFASIVTPVAPTEGGPFCALPTCLFAGTPHQGKVVKMCRTVGGLEAN